MKFPINKYLDTDRFRIEIKDNNGEVDVILGHSEHMLHKYHRNNIKLKSGWFYRNISLNVDFLLYVIDKYNIKKINFLGTSKFCSGAVILTKELLKKGIDIKYNLFMFSPYTTVNKEVYEKRGIVDKVPRTLTYFWESDRYTIHAINRMEARRLIDKPNVHMYLFYPKKSEHGEKDLVLRVKGDNVTHVELPVYMHNTFFPFWKEVDDKGIIELYENVFKKIHKDDYRFYSRMQNNQNYKFHLYTLLSEPEVFIEKLNQFIENEKGIKVGPNTKLSKNASIEAPVRLWGTAVVKRECFIGAFSFVNSASTIFPRINIGRYCSIGKQCEIEAGDHPFNWLSSSVFQYGIEVHFPEHTSDCNQIQFIANKQSEITTIGNDIWIGSQALIKGSPTIGDGAVIACGAVVIHDVPPCAIVGGPAKVLKYRFDKKTIEKLLALKWWELMPKDMKNVKFDDIQKAIKQIVYIKDSKKIFEGVYNESSE